jgi:hypothetical protein
MSDQIITLRLLREPSEESENRELLCVTWSYLDENGIESGGLDENELPIPTNNGSGVLTENTQPNLMDMLSYINTEFEDIGRNYRLTFDSFSADENDCTHLKCRVLFMDPDEQQAEEVTIGDIREDLYLYLVDGFNGYDIGLDGHLQFELL